MMIILAGKKEEHLNMLEGGIIAKLLEEKWTTFAQVLYYFDYNLGKDDLELVWLGWVYLCYVRLFGQGSQTQAKLGAAQGQFRSFRSISWVGVRKRVWVKVSHCCTP